MSEIYLCDITLKTKLGAHKECGIICVKKSIEEMQNDKHVFYRIFRGKLEGWKKTLVTDFESDNPKIISVDWIKSLGESFV